VKPEAFKERIEVSAEESLDAIERTFAAYFAVAQSGEPTSPRFSEILFELGFFLDRVRPGYLARVTAGVWS
jgi:hypothetical protein